MTGHLPECELMESFGADTPEHGFCSRQQTYCIHCERACICERLRAVEQRALNAAREAVAALATQRELRSPSGVEIDINQALAAIDALKEEQ